ncbi:MAG: ABC transporter permease [Bdellovibrio sp.]
MDLKIQVLTLAVLVICGVAVLVSSWSAYQALSRAGVKYYETYKFADVFVEFERAPSNILDRVQKIKNVEFAQGRIVEEALLDMPGQAEPALGRFISWNQSSMINKLYLREGRFPEPGSTQDVLVHESFAKAHKLHSGDTFIAYFHGEKARLRVCGIGLSPEYIYALSPLAYLPDDKHFGVFWMEEHALEQLAQMKGAYNSVVLTVSRGALIDEIKTQLDQIVKPYGSLGAYGRDKQLSNLLLQDEISQQKSSAALIPAIFVIVGAFILNVVMNRLISLHRAQISILKALGYSSGDLTIYYFKLASIILLLGILPAMLFAYGIGQWYASLYEKYFRFPKIEFSLTVQSVSLGLFAGLVPGWLASLRALSVVFRLTPAEGMRPPSPPTFKKSILEKMGFFEVRDIRARMILRDLFFHPTRSLSAIFGIAAAIGILINGSFWIDISNFMLKRQFYEMSREDLEVRFTYPRKKDVINELSRLPGVFYIEGARTVPVRLHFKGLTKDTALIARDGGSAMRQILDRQGQVIAIPSSGVLMSTYFKKKYSFKVGDTIELEVLQGRRLNLQVLIAGFIDDIIGASAYISPDILHRMLGEEPSVDTVNLKIVPSLKEQIYIKLKESPIVASVSVRDLLIKSFKNTMLQMIVAFTMILIVFAVAISGAVLFNIARITLSEKNWELASLRILGFPVGFVFNLLFLFLGIQVIFASVPGLLLGYILSYISVRLIHSDMFVFPLVIENSTYALAIVTIIFTYLLGGFFLYKKIETLNLSEALKARE